MFGNSCRICVHIRHLGRPCLDSSIPMLSRTQPPTYPHIVVFERRSGPHRVISDPQCHFSMPASLIACADKEFMAPCAAPRAPAPAPRMDMGCSPVEGAVGPLLQAPPSWQHGAVGAGTPAPPGAPGVAIRSTSRLGQDSAGVIFFFAEGQHSI